MDKIAIIYTTFLRSELAMNTISSIISNWIPNSKLFIGDQNKIAGKIYDVNLNFEIFSLPFDCGLSYARNYLINKANEEGYKYCLITADSIEFNSIANLQPVIDFMKKDDLTALVGFKLNNRVSWEYLMELVPGKHFNLIKPTETIEDNGIKYTECNIVKNFFLAKTEALLNVPWDNALKMHEHEDFFWRLKQKTYKVFYTDYFSANYIDFKPPEYLKYRQRMYSEFRKIFQEKYKIKGWVKIIK